MSTLNAQGDYVTDLRGMKIPAKPYMTSEFLEQENRCFQGTGGVSSENRSAGYLPAFRDELTGRIYLSRFSNGRIAPIHLLDSLPDALLQRHFGSVQNSTAHAQVTSGFVSDGRFFTRGETAIRIQKSLTH